MQKEIFMKKSLNLGSSIMGLIGSISSCVVAFICYLNVAAQGNVVISILVLIGGIIGGIVGIIGTAYIRLNKLLTPVMQLISFALVLVGAVAMVVYCGIPDPKTGIVDNSVLVSLPFLFVPDILIGVAGILSMLAIRNEQ